MRGLESRSRRLAYRTLHLAGIISRVRKRQAHQARILAYHSVAPHANDFTAGLDVTVTPDTFERQMDYVWEHYRIVGLTELLEQLARGGLRERLAVLTFDDGFADVYRYAFPVLRARRVPATVFLVADALDQNGVLWMHRLAYLVNRKGADAVLRAARSALTNAGTPSATIGGLRRWLALGVSTVERRDTLSVLEQSLGLSAEDAPERSQLYLDGRHVAEMRGAGITFGSHTTTHTALATLPEDQQEQELRRAWEAIAPLCDGHPPLAYPFGGSPYATERTREIAVATGHRAILEAEGGLVRLGEDPTRLQRIKVEEEPVEAFAARIEGVSIRSALAGHPSRQPRSATGT